MWLSDFISRKIVMFDQQRRYDREELTQILEVSVLQFLAMLNHVKFCHMIPIFCVLRTTFEVFALSWDPQNTKMTNKFLSAEQCGQGGQHFLAFKNI